MGLKLKPITQNTIIKFYSKFSTLFHIIAPAFFKQILPSPSSFHLLTFNLLKFWNIDIRSFLDYF